MSKILITGHMGWIGTNFTDLLDSWGIEWMGIDKLTGEDLLTDISYLKHKIFNCDVVVHLAGTPRIPGSWTDPDHYRNNNVGVTEQVARICAEHKKYLIFASSSSIYGDGDGPLNPYSWTKLAGEQAIQMYGRSKNLKYTIARIFTNYGEEDPSGLVIGRWIHQKQNGHPITIRGNGEQSRDFIHVSDTAQALLSICIKRPDNQILDIGTGHSYKLKDIAELIGGEVVFEPELAGYATHTKANVQHTNQHISWSPRYKLFDWIRSQVFK